MWPCGLKQDCVLRFVSHKVACFEFSLLTSFSIPAPVTTPQHCFQGKEPHHGLQALQGHLGATLSLATSLHMVATSPELSQE